MQSKYSSVIASLSFALFVGALISGCTSVPAPPPEVPWEKPPTFEERFCEPVLFTAPKESTWNYVPLMSGKAGYDFIKRPGAFVWDAKHTVDCVSPDGRWLLSARMVRQEVRTEEKKKGKQDENKYSKVFAAEQIRVWDLTDPDAKTAQYSFFDSASRGVSWLAFTPDGSSFVVYRQTLPGSLTLHDRDSGKIVRTIPIKDPATAGTISPDGQLIAMSMNRSIEIWELRTGNRLAFLPLTMNPGIAELRYSPCGRLLFALTPGKSVQIFDVQLYSEVASIPVGIPSSMDLSPDGRCLLIAAATENKSLEVGNTSDSDKKSNIKPGKKDLEKKEWANFGFSTVLRFYEIGSWRLLREEKPGNGGRYAFRTVRFSKDGETLLAAGSEFDDKSEAVLPKTVLCSLNLRQAGAGWTELDYTTLPLHRDGRFLLGGRKEALSILSPFDTPRNLVAEAQTKTR